MLGIKKPYWGAQLIGWIIFFLFQYFLLSYQGSTKYPENHTLIFGQALTSTVIGFLMSHILRWFAIKFHILNKNLGSQILWFIIFIIVVSFISSAIEFSVLKTFSAELKKDVIPIQNHKYTRVIFSNAIIWCLYYFIWSTLYLMYHYIIITKQQEIDTLKLKSLVKELELKTIKAHINPHFIFNSLNGIRAMIDEDPQRARTAITELSNILRSGINIDKSETVALAEELNIIKDYLALEQMRFDDRLHIEMKIDDNTIAQQVPPMMLQMLVENAIKHGISKEINGGTVRVGAHLNDTHLELTVENTGALKEQQIGGGFGLKSIYERLALMYGHNAAFEITDSGRSSVLAKLNLPITL